MFLCAYCSCGCPEPVFHTYYWSLCSHTARIASPAFVSFSFMVLDWTCSGDVATFPFSSTHRRASCIPLISVGGHRYTIRSLNRITSIIFDVCFDHCMPNGQCPLTYSSKYHNTGYNLHIGSLSFTYNVHALRASSKYDPSLACV